MKISKGPYRVVLLGAVLSGALVSAAQGQEIVVRDGQTLSEIAAEHLGSEARWPEICEANRAALNGNCHLIHPGLALTLPGADEGDVEPEAIAEPAVEEAEESSDELATEAPETGEVTEVALGELPPNNATVTETDEVIDGLAVKEVVTDEGEGQHRVRYSLGALSSAPYEVRWIVRFDTAEAANLMIFDDENRSYVRIHLARTDEGVEIADRTGVDSAAVTDIGNGWHELTFAFAGRPSERMTQLLIYPTSELMADTPSYTLSMTDPIVTIAD